MRLTLRTLLAYVDDILEPSQAKEIGAKISESGFALSLMARIREVMRRRRLTSPDLEGPGSGLDPNMVAEYLDNVLPPEKVPDVEKVCLESDVHLAEVAACHQILTAALGEPVQILPESREHMYALGPIGNGAAPLAVDAAPRPLPIAEGLSPAKTNGHTHRPQPAADEAGGESSFETSIPEYLRQRPLWKRAFPYIVVGLVAAVWIGLLKFDEWQKLSPAPQNVVAQNDAQPPGAAADFGGEPPAAAIDAAVPAEGEGNAEEMPAGALPIDDVPIDPLPPLDEAAGDLPVVDAKPPGALTLPPAPAAPIPGDNPPNDAPPNKVAVNIPVAKPQPDAVPVPAAPAIERPALQYVSADGILLRYDDLVGDWMVMSPRAMVHPGERFAAPEPYDAEVKVGDGGARATFHGGSVFSVLPPNAAGSIGFAVERGRLSLAAVNATAAPADAQDAPAKPLMLSIGVGNELFRVELLSPDAVCGIDVVLIQPNQFEQDLGVNPWVAQIVVASGSIRLADAAGQVELIEGPASRPLLPTPAEGQEKPAAATIPLSIVPAWLDPDGRQQGDLTARRSATLFEDEFDAQRPLRENVYSLIADDRPYISTLAVKSLSLVGDHAAMVKGLNSLHEESRSAAIAGLRDWLGQAQNNGVLLKQDLEKHFAAEKVDLIYRLLWGFNEEDLRDRATSLHLVGWLDHNDLIVRELAFHYIYHLTGIRHDYNPLRPPAQRRGPIGRWEDRIKNEGALIPPAPKS